MKHLLVIFILSGLFWATDLQAAYVQSACHEDGGSISSVSVNPATETNCNGTCAAFTAGNAIVVAFNIHTTAGFSFTNITDGSSGGNAYVAGTGSPIDSGSASKTWGFTAANIKGGSYSVTANFGFGAPQAEICVIELSGRSTSSLVDTSNGNFDGSATTSHSTGAVTTTIAGDDVVGCGFTSNSGGWGLGHTTAGSGWTKKIDTGAQVNTGICQVQENVGTGTYTNAWSENIGNSVASGMVFALKLSTGPPPGAPKALLFLGVGGE